MTVGRDPPVAPDTETITSPPADPYTVQAEVFAAAVLDGTPLPFPPSDAIANMRVIDLIVETAAPTAPRLSAEHRVEPTGDQRRIERPIVGVVTLDISVRGWPATATGMALTRFAAASSTEPNQPAPTAARTAAP